MEPLAPGPASPPGPPAKRSATAKLAGAVGRNPHAALAVIVVLTIVVASMYVYYHGVSRLGPFAARGGHRPERKPPARKEPPADPPPESGDPETERLIAAINTK